MRLFIVTYRTQNGPVRVEIEGLSWKEVRALFSLFVGSTLCVQEVRT